MAPKSAQEAIGYRRGIPGTIPRRNVSPETALLQHGLVEGQDQVARQLDLDGPLPAARSAVTVAGTGTTISKPSNTLPARSRARRMAGGACPRM